MGYSVYTIVTAMMTVLVIGASRLAWRSRIVVWFEAREGYDEYNVTMVRLFSFHMLEY
jgi:hypothetical protein